MTLDLLVRERPTLCGNCRRPTPTARHRYCSPKCRVAQEYVRRAEARRAAASRPCLRCTELKAPEAFLVDARYQQGRQPWCSECCERYRQGCRARAIRVDWYHAHGIHPMDQDAIWSQQQGRCACGRVFARLGEAHLEHDSVTGLVRAFVCASCCTGDR